MTVKMLKFWVWESAKDDSGGQLIEATDFRSAFRQFRTIYPKAGDVSARHHYEDEPEEPPETPHAPVPQWEEPPAAEPKPAPYKDEESFGVAS